MFDKRGEVASACPVGGQVSYMIASNAAVGSRTACHGSACTRAWSPNGSSTRRCASRTTPWCGSIAV